MTSRILKLNQERRGRKGTKTDLEKKEKERKMEKKWSTVQQNDRTLRKENVQLTRTFKPQTDTEVVVLSPKTGKHIQTHRGIRLSIPERASKGASVSVILN